MFFLLWFIHERRKEKQARKSNENNKFGRWLMQLYGSMYANLQKKTFFRLHEKCYVNFSRHIMQAKWK